jgi:signal transduction histidine kinase
MKKLVVNGWEFVRKNPTIISSLLLIFFVAAIIFFNASYSLNKFQSSASALTQSKAILAENAMGILVADSFYDKQWLQHKIEKIKNVDSEIKEITISVPLSGKEGFQTTASTNQDAIGQESNSITNILAWNGKEGIASIGNEKGNRFWNVINTIKNNQGEKIGLVSMKFSFLESDKFIQDAITRTYVISIISAFLVLLFVLNHFRLFKYEVRATHLEEVDRMKDDFISMASHELRNPLGSLRGYVEIAKEVFHKEEKIEKREKVEHCLDSMEMLTAQLDNLVNDILEVSRIEQNRLPVNFQPVELPEIISKIVGDMKSAAEKKSLRLIYEKKELSKVYADPERVKQIIINLIGNAIKYTIRGKVEIKTKEDAKNIFITVEDEGMGISGESLKNLFTKFYRIKRPETERIIGTGLGLWISRELACKMEGDILVESIKGIGSRFTLKLKKLA